MFTNIRKSVRFDSDFGIVVLIFLVSLLIVLALRYRAEDTFNPLRYPVPQAILNTGRAEGIPGMALLQHGEIIQTQGIKCNDSDTTLAIEGSVSLVRISPIRTIISMGNFSTIIQPGCTTYNFNNIMPQEVSAGTWRLEGIEKTIYNGNYEEAVWYSDYFMIAP